MSLRSTTFSRAPPGCGVCVGGNDSLSPSLFLRAQRAIFSRVVRFLSIFEPSIEPWRAARNPNLTLALGVILTLTSCDGVPPLTLTAHTTLANPNDTRRPFA